MAYIMAILMFNLDTYKAFKCFSNLVIGNKMIRAFYKFNTLKVILIYYIYMNIKNRLKDILEHLNSFCKIEILRSMNI